MNNNGNRQAYKPYDRSQALAQRYQKPAGVQVGNLGDVAQLGQAPAPPAEPKPQQFFDRDPYPKIDSGSIPAGQSVTVVYTNGLQEISEVQQIMVKAPPLVTVEIHREEDNQDQGVAVAQRVQDLDTDEAGNPTLFFRQVERDKTLAVRKNQKLSVILTNPYAFAVNYRLKIFKNALRFYTPRDIVKEAAVGR